MNVLAGHVDRPDADRHRLVLLDDRRLRCLDCERTLLLPAPSSADGSTSPSSLDHPRTDQERCPQHRHEWAYACRACAADAKATSSPRPRPAPSPPTGQDWEAVRARWPRTETTR